jgi:hypothetical protein
MSETSSGREEERPRLCSRLLVWLPMLVGLYIFSIGPVVALVERFPGRSETVEAVVMVFYWPLVKVAKSEAGAPLRAWIDWCVKTLGPKHEKRLATP